MLDDTMLEAEDKMEKALEVAKELSNAILEFVCLATQLFITECFKLRFK